MMHGIYSRREVMRVGCLSALGLGLNCLPGFQMSASGQSTLPLSSAGSADGPRARNCILIWLDGGPSHLETWDMKPDAPAEVRGPLSTISTGIAGIQISECLPLMAQRMDQVAVIRSMTSPLGEHNLGTHYLLTGFSPTPALEYPAFHAVGSFLESSRTSHASAAGSGMSAVLPSNIAVPNYSVGGAAFSGRGFLSPQYAPFETGGDPAAPDFQVRDLGAYPGIDGVRLSRRQAFVQKLTELDQRHNTNTAHAEKSEFNRAFQMITSTPAREAFHLDSEPTTVRQRYGLKTVGQSCLLARRLIERGVPFVTVNHRGWDTHERLYTQLKEGYTGAGHPVGLIPSLDLGLSALLDDLRDRGLLQQTLVVVMGEFGRTPKINAAGGRDHWPRVFSVALAGGGIRGGQVIGSSDRTGESPLHRPVTPADLACTIYHLLGIQADTELRTSDGRPVRITADNAQVVSELLA